MRIKKLKGKLSPVAYCFHRGRVATMASSASPHIFTEQTAEKDNITNTHSLLLPTYQDGRRKENGRLLTPEGASV